MRSTRSRIQTYSGGSLDPINPDPRDVDIVDIASALGKLCRYTGHTRRFYSVAEHSVLISRAVPPELALWGLLHDASEAYICDVSRPVKHDERMRSYREIENGVLLAIAAAFELPVALPDVLPAAVKECDERILSNEARVVFTTGPNWLWYERLQKVPPLPNVTIEFWTPDEAPDRFMDRFAELTGHAFAITPAGVDALDAENEKEKSA